MSVQHKTRKKSSNFSIAHILANETIKTTPTSWSIHLIKMSSIPDKLIGINCSNKSEVDQRNFNDIVPVDFTKNEHNFIDNKFYTSSLNEHMQRVNEQQCKELFYNKKRTVSSSDFSWLQCTRYQPPKIPKRSYNNGTCKRKPATHPRIPFTSFQQEVLEKKYQNSAYLSKNDVHQLSTILKLPHNRIKIWFQNRRARNRKEIKLNNL